MRLVQKASPNVSVELYILDETIGTPELGVTFDQAGIDLNYRRDLEAVQALVPVTLAALTTAHTPRGFIEIANGRYRFDVPDAAFATGVSQVTIGGTITGMVVLPVTIQLVDFDPDDVVRLGLTALPNAIPDAANGMVVSDTGGVDMDLVAANAARCTEVRMAVLTDWIEAGRLDQLIDDIKVVTDKLGDTVEDDSGTYRFTTNALEQAPSGTGGDATAANQVTITAHLTDLKGTGFIKDTSSNVNLAHKGADGDTLKTLSDQIDVVSGGETVNIHTESTSVES